MFYTVYSIRVPCTMCGTEVREEIQALMETINKKEKLLLQLGTQKRITKELRK